MYISFGTFVNEYFEKVRRNFGCCVASPVLNKSLQNGLKNALYVDYEVFYCEPRRIRHTTNNAVKVMKALEGTQKGKAAYGDNVTTHLLKDGGDIVFKKLPILYTKCFLRRRVPEF